MKTALITGVTAEFLGKGRARAELDHTIQAVVKNIRVGQDLTIPDPAVIDVTRYSMAHHVLPDCAVRKLFDLGRLQAQGWSRCTRFRERLLQVSRNFLTHHTARTLATYSVQI